MMMDLMECPSNILLFIEIEHQFCVNVLCWHVQFGQFQFPVHVKVVKTELVKEAIGSKVNVQY